ncbi:hypothetical protein [Nonomuraea aridisoli]|uniref:Uncharacterized protein n=1 Tax=Nonomuraea aridisoli TaxID=2070368 RepID=A0A2W2EYY0_9ACTN|nr:hypothetical protein [Nonomuraea aridisoli]PZG14557.1 hypothetical protein C1J01_26595 [Nonomuraea aridisoli]
MEVERLMRVEPARVGAESEARWMHDDLVERIVAGTDVGNVPTAAAFLRAEYAETGRLFRYCWRAL